VVRLIVSIIILTVALMGPGTMSAAHAHSENVDTGHAASLRHAETHHEKQIGSDEVDTDTLGATRAAHFHVHVLSDVVPHVIQGGWMVARNREAATHALFSPNAPRNAGRQALKRPPRLL
jgi:hypothetical protein